MRVSTVRVRCILRNENNCLVTLYYFNCVSVGVVAVPVGTKNVDNGEEGLTGKLTVVKPSTGQVCNQGASVQPRLKFRASSSSSSSFFKRQQERERLYTKTVQKECFRSCSTRTSEHTQGNKTEVVVQVLTVRNHCLISSVLVANGTDLFDRHCRVFVFNRSV